MNTSLQDQAVHPPHAKNSPVRAAVASMAGGTLEYYDNYIYALAAALVFGKIGRSVEREEPPVRGVMLWKVRHVLKVEEL